MLGTSSQPQGGKIWSKERRKIHLHRRQHGSYNGHNKGELSFVVGGVNFGVTFEGIPLNEPLVPYVLLNTERSSVELDMSEVKEDVNNYIFVPSDVIAKSITWDSITLSWDAVEGVSFYQIEVDGSVQQLVSTTNAFTKKRTSCRHKVQFYCV